MIDGKGGGGGVGGGSGVARGGVGGSRLKSGVERIFEVYLEIALLAEPSTASSSSASSPSLASASKLSGRVVRKYPSDFAHEDILQTAVKFAFPSTKSALREPPDHGSAAAVQSFTFVKTEEDSSFLFGFCRQSSSLSSFPVTACILTFLPWHNAFKKLLDILAEIGHQKGDVMTMLCQVYTHPVLVPNEVEHFNVGVETFSLEAPDTRNRLPSVPGDANMTEYYLLESQHMISVFAAILHERRVLFLSKSLKKLTSCIFAAESLIYPMYWQHIFIPVLPESLVDYISAPMPYLIGIPTELFEAKVKSSTGMLGDAVLVDLDKNTLQTEYNDVESLPNSTVADLKKKLKASYTGGDVISRAFLHALVTLIGGYREALTFLPNQKIQFDEAAFLASRPAHMKHFLESLLHLQIFQQFIEGRLTYLNQGEGFCDERDVFEKECSLVKIGQKAGDHYQVWLRENGKRLGARLKSAGKGVRRAGVKGGKKIHGKMKEITTTVKGNFDDHALKEKFRNSAKEIRDTNRTGGSSGSGSLDKSSLGSDSLGGLASNSAPNSPVLRPARPATSYVPPRAFTPERLINEDEHRPRSAAFGAAVVVAAPRRHRRGDNFDHAAGNSPSIGAAASSRKYRVIGDPDDDDDDDDEDGDDEEESYDEAEEASMSSGVVVDGRQTTKKTPPQRPPAPGNSASSSFDAFLPPKVENLDLFKDPDIIGLIDGGGVGTVGRDVGAKGGGVSEQVSSSPLIPHIPGPVPPPRRKRTGSSAASDAVNDLPADCVPGRPGEPPVNIGSSVGENAAKELISFGVHESALAAATNSLHNFSTADFDPLNETTVLANLVAKPSPQQQQQQQQRQQQPMHDSTHGAMQQDSKTQPPVTSHQLVGRNFSNPLYKAATVQSGPPVIPPKTSRPQHAFSPQPLPTSQSQLHHSQMQTQQHPKQLLQQQQRPNGFQASHSSSSSSHNSKQLYQQQHRLSGNNNSLMSNGGGTTNNNTVFHPSMTNCSIQGLKTSSPSSFVSSSASFANANSAGSGARTLLNSEDERLLQEWSLLSVGSVTDTTAAPPPLLLSGPTPPAREKSQHQLQQQSGVATSRPRPSLEGNNATAADPFADLVTF